MILQEKYFRAASVTDSVFIHGKLCIKLYIRVLGVVIMNFKKHMVLIEVVSQHLE